MQCIQMRHNRLILDVDTDFQPGIDVIVIDYKTPRDLSEFLESYSKFQPSVPVTLHVGLVQPTPEDEEIARQIDDGFIYGFIDNVGYSGSVNQISARCKREVLAIFNADCVLAEGVLQECYDALMKHPTWAVLGPRQVDEQNRLTHAGIIGPPDRPSQPGWMQRDYGQFSDVNEDVVNVSGAAYFVRHEVWNDLTACPIFRKQSNDAPGGFLNTVHYYEESAFSYHARAHGWKTVYYGPVKMIHKYHKASPVNGPRDQLMGESREKFRVFCHAHGIVCE